MDTFEDMANLAEGFQVKTTIKSTGEPRLYRGQLRNVNLDVEDESEGSKSQQPQALPSSIQGQCFPEFTLFPKLPLELRRKIWGFTVEPRLIEEKYCRHFGEKYGPHWEKKVRTLFPLNIVPYSSMPASFWACSESRNEVARCYVDIAAISKTRMLSERYSQMPIETIRPLLRADPFSLDQAIANFKRLCEEDSSLPLPPSVPFNPDQDIIRFDSLKTIDIRGLREWLSELRLLRENMPMPSDRKAWRVDDYPFEPPFIVHPSLVKRKNGAMKAMIFIGFIYQDLDEFIIQDSDCKFPHKLDLPENRELWTKWILWIFKVQSAHEEYAFMRAGSAFKVSKVVIRPGVKIARPFEDCSEGQKYAQSMDSQDKEDSDDSDLGCFQVWSDVSNSSGE
ncbi:hypothetical protein sscle_10g077270 [Sclerotinia sclerotiorum 1980 UF-70]|uniref:2EXR domain-containing protein n=1 Tax=Sclerotinia sclerotiorum (strain ATCC 18683 / 1980 / Ss-1) TaxID=665079 RepID=A0A1D9QDE8_SCLS1|nr:hypothetical protein sscle_10g077270 [Sclerotinia sclerotiorum 1980 UF-70]